MYSNTVYDFNGEYKEKYPFFLNEDSKCHHTPWCLAGRVEMAYWKSQVAVLVGHLPRGLLGRRKVLQAPGASWSHRVRASLWGKPEVLQAGKAVCFQGQRSY